MTWTAPLIERTEFPLDLPERENLVAYVNFHRETLLWKCQGLTGEQLATRSVPTTTMSLLGLVRHLANVERIWWRIRVDGQDVERIYAREADAEFDDLDPANAEADFAQLHAEWAACDAVAARYDLDHVFDDGHGDQLSIRTLWLHLIEEYARHNGHADLLREAIDGATGE